MPEQPYNPAHVLPYAKAFLEEMQSKSDAMDRASRHVVLIFDPETQHLSTVGPYADYDTAVTRMEALDSQINHPRNNDGERILLRPVVLEEDD